MILKDSVHWCSPAVSSFAVRRTTYQGSEALRRCLEFLHCVHIEFLGRMFEVSTLSKDGVQLFQYATNDGENGTNPGMAVTG